MDGEVRVGLGDRLRVEASKPLPRGAARGFAPGKRLRLPGLGCGRYCSRTFCTLSHCDMSDTMTLSFGCSPLTISMVLTELRPSFTFTRLAVLPSGSSLKSPTVLSA